MISLLQDLREDAYNQPISAEARSLVATIDPDAPSWAPLLQIPFHMASKARAKWQWSFGRLFPAQAIIRPDSNQLIARGFVFDRLEFTTRCNRDFGNLSVGSSATLFRNLDSLMTEPLNHLFNPQLMESEFRESYQEFLKERDPDLLLNFLRRRFPYSADHKAIATMLWKTLVCDTNYLEGGDEPQFPAPESFNRMFYLLCCQGCNDRFIEDYPRKNFRGRPNPKMQFVLSAATEMHLRTLCVTKQGYMCMGPHRAEPNDYVVMLHGASMPVVLRRRSQSSDKYTLIGDAYVDDHMRKKCSDRVKGVLEVLAKDFIIE